MPQPARMEVFPSPRGSQATPTRGAGFTYFPFIQPSGTPFVPHFTKPFVIRGSRLLRFSGMGLQPAPGTSQTLGGPSSSTPLKGSTEVLAARVLLKADGTQL